MADITGGFLKEPGKINLISINRLEDPPASAIYLHPFIESFNHSISPAIGKMDFGMMAAKTQFFTGLSENTYTLRLALPAYSEQNAAQNWSTVQKLKELVNPTMTDLLTKSGKVEFKVFNLTGKKVGQLLQVQEAIAIEQGFLWYRGNKKKKIPRGRFPKLIRISLTFVEDVTLTAMAKKVSEEKAKQSGAQTNTTEPRPTDSKANPAPPSSIAAAARDGEESAAVQGSQGTPSGTPLAASRP